MIEWTVHWYRSTHVPMRADLDFVHEARDRHDQTLYRLYLIWDRSSAELIAVTGKSKPNNTVIAPAEYDDLARLGRTILASDPRPYAVVDDVVRLMLPRAERDLPE